MLNNKKGIAMLLVISLILMLLILGGAVLMISTGHFSTSFHQIKRARAFYAAEAAMQHILWKLRTGQISTFPHSETMAGTTINKIPGEDINIVVGQQNVGVDPEGVYPVNITVEY